MKKFIAYFILLLLPSLTCAELKSEFRDGYIREFVPSCFKSQRAANQNAQLSDKTLQAFCTCMASYTADKLNAEQVISVASASTNKNPIPVYYKKIQSDGMNYCISNIETYKQYAK